MQKLENQTQYKRYLRKKLRVSLLKKVYFWSLTKTEATPK
ncbi:hypothetical protein VIBC2010_04187 [Vibrio caribbeanicus ATCC BAA-2122]|uniref:Uncharacterized protein n=1 Tax=Vibrio caribbeanicus ATCC BAA-2122 TaxID=796620 RepID=E3BPJ1_9VIBR|nr:hypothetical protein VIBC2010_04187 [Vibrio caribbeanicus ATCC BAA-2122]